MDTTKQNSFTDHIIAGLRNTANELEELRLQVHLGKAELKDVFEEEKQKFKQELQGWKHQMEGWRKGEAVRTMVNAVEHLQVQLAIGLAETADIYSAQRKKVEQALAALEAQLRAEMPQEQLASIHLSIERFKSKMELMAMAYQLKKLKLAYNLSEKKDEFEKHLAEWRSELHEKTQELKENWDEKKKMLDAVSAKLKTLFFPID